MLAIVLYVLLYRSKQANNARDKDKAMTKKEVIQAIERLSIDGKKRLLSHFRSCHRDSNQLLLAKQVASKFGVLEAMEIMKSIECKLNNV